MSVSFYRKNKRRGREIATMGYGKFNFIRDIFMGCWNPEFAFLCNCHLFLNKDLRFRDANPPLPDDLLPLVSLPDCEGEMTADEVASLVKTLESNETFMLRKPFPLIRKELGIYTPVMCDNGWMNNPDWREEANKFYMMLKDCAKRKCGIEWF